MPLSCPHCGRSVREGALTCPYCQASLDVTQRLSLGDASWCPDCGALLAPDATKCPKCGCVIEQRPRRRARTDMNLPDFGGTGSLESRPELEGSGRTGVLTRIESAIPAADDDSSPSGARDHMPRPRAFALAAIFAVLVVGGAALLITHPWDPTASITRASEPADTSMSGFPGVVEALTGQDRGSGSDEGDDGDQKTDPFTAIEDAHKQLSTLEQKVGESEDALRAACKEGEAEDAAAGLKDAQQLSIQVSNLISDVGLLSDADGAYAEDLEHLQTLGNWLRNRCDALTSAWQQAADADDLAAAAGSVTATLDGARDYERLFDENYDAWAPERVDAADPSPESE